MSEVEVGLQGEVMTLPQDSAAARFLYIEFDETESDGSGPHQNEDRMALITLYGMLGQNQGDDAVNGFRGLESYRSPV